MVMSGSGVQEGEEELARKRQGDSQGRREDGQDSCADDSFVCSSSPSYLSGVRRALHDDFDRQVRLSCECDTDSRSSSRSNDDEVDPYRRFDDDDDEDHDDTSHGGFESMLELEDMERSLDYHDYLDREIDAYLEEPMRQLMREMEKEMEESYAEDVEEEDGYYGERRVDGDRTSTLGHVQAVTALESKDFRARRETASVGSSSTYASVQASIQHAIIYYKNWTLASSKP